MPTRPFDVKPGECQLWVRGSVADPLARGIQALGLRATFQAAGRAPDISYIDMPEALRGKYQYYTQADMSRLRAAGYNAPMTSLEDGVADYVAGYLNTDDPFR